MDPNECARIILESVKVGDTRTARDAAIALLEWLGRGGFKPDAALCAELAKITRAQGHVARVVRAVSA